MKLVHAPVRQRMNRRAAFTLLEVLVVVAILVILAGVGVVATTRYLDDARKSKAQMACQGIAQAMESYKMNAANPTNDYPQSLQELLAPSFGGSGFLKNGESDMIDPWGQQFQIQFIQSNSDLTGTSQMPLVYTTAPDGTPISQYGIGPKAQVP
jgi:general secretion pathway protein G